MEVKKIAAALTALMTDTREMPVLLTPWHAWCVAQAVQLACRHPLFQGKIRLAAESTARQIFDHVTAHDPDLFELARSGWDANCDVPHGEKLKEIPPALAERELAPRPSRRDLECLETLLSDQRENHLTAHLFRIIKRMDPENRRRLARSYPHHVAAVEQWELTGSAPPGPPAYTVPE